MFSRLSHWISRQRRELDKLDAYFGRLHLDDKDSRELDRLLDRTRAEL